MITLGIATGLRPGPVGRGHEEGIGKDTIDRWQAVIITVLDQGVAKEETGVVVCLREVMPSERKLWNGIMHRRIALDTKTYKVWYHGGGL